ncbi:AmpG family muropeptide MFS transporter [Salinicola socius]|uniref:AmpG family muropeptide MFS transporter n=1 Tax=Salinicola socius TaxID=404433 RepID=A0A1Q8SW04_9GAMM|nr:MFS transporter [Salinicola socius]OLO05611.1 AmpG family muropeptide MFS transporter [Salinicola socius]
MQHEPRDWLSSLRVYLRAPVVTLLFLGFSAGLPYLLVFSTLTAWLEDSGVEVAAIGFFSWVGLLYSIKLFWAPIVDRVRLPLIGRLLGQRRSWMLLGQTLIAAGLLGLSGLDPAGHLPLVAAFALLTAFGAATQDIVIDAYRIESGEAAIQAAMASTYIIGYRIGIVMAGAGALYIADAASWGIAYLSMAALVSIGVITVLVRPEPPRPQSLTVVLFHPRVKRFLRQRRNRSHWQRQAGVWLIAAVICPISDFFQRYGRLALWLLVFIGIYRISDISMAAMANPLYLSLGFTKSDIASVTKVFGVLMTIGGGVLGGLMVVRYGIGRMLVLGALAVALTNLLFALLATGGDSLALLIVAITGDNLANGLASTVFIAFLSSLTSRTYTATQYALFSSLMTLPGKFIGGFSGLVVADVGYASFFVIVCLLGLPAVALAWWLSRRLPTLGNDGDTRNDDGETDPRAGREDHEPASVR